MLYVHGAEGEPGGGLTWMKIASRARIINAVADAGHTILSCDLGGVSTWGNDTVISRLTTAYNYLTGLPGVSPGAVVLIGQSMGGQNSMVWAALNKAKVRCIVALIPVVNIQDVRDRVYTSLVDAAYAGGYNDATYGARHNPYVIAGNGGLNGIPIQVWYGDSDTTCLPSFAQALDARADSVELHQVSGGHAEATVGAVDPAMVLEFIQR